MWRKIQLAIFSLVSVMSLLMVVSVVQAQGQRQSGEVVLGSKAANLDACVLDTDDMRRNHMDHLKHKRVQVMRQGIRTDDVSLASCINCHAGTDSAGHYVPVNAEGQFCQSCHERVGESPDCFQCHRTTPDSQ